MSDLNSSTENLIKYLKLHLDKTNLLTKKQAYFIVKFLNDGSQAVYINLFFLLLKN